MDRMQIRQPKKRYTSRKDIFGERTVNSKSTKADERSHEFKAASKAGMAKSERLMNAWLTGKL